jgi:predicted nucleic acid-binding protein
MTPSLIVDCSIAMTWLFEDERTQKTDEIQDRLANEAAIVPHHWPLEVANVLALAERRRRISRTDSEQFLQLLAVMVITVDRACEFEKIGQLLPLCREHGLTSYDSAYLELAIRMNLPIATLDKDLRRAATKAGIELLG